MSDLPFYISYLSSTLEKRKSEDPKYSLRKFANDIGLHSSTLSNILHGYRPFPWRKARVVASQLNMSDDVFKKFVESIHKDVTSEDLERSADVAFRELDPNKYAHIIENWEYFAVLNYFSMSNAIPEAKPISERFGISAERAEKVIRDLTSLGFLEIVDNRITRKVLNIRTTEDIRAQSLQAAHVQEMDLAKQRMKEIEPLMRDISSITFAGDSKKIRIAKKAIRAFRKRICNLMQTETTDNVYLFSIQMVPMTLPKKESRAT